MSNDGTKPPSIAPRGAGTGTASARPRPAAPPPRSDAPPQPGSAPTSGAPAGAGSSPSAARPAGEGSDGPAKPSVADRLKKAAASAAQTARNAVPTREAGELDEDRAEAARPAVARPATARPATARPAATPEPEAQYDGGPRKVRLAVARVDPWSVMKLAFLLSVAIGIMVVVASAVVWFTLDGLQVFTRVNDTITEITGDPNFFNLLEYVAFDRVLSLATMIAVVDVVLLTALSTIGAFLYNIVTTLVGGISVTLTDD